MHLHYMSSQPITLKPLEPATTPQTRHPVIGPPGIPIPLHNPLYNPGNSTINVDYEGEEEEEEEAEESMEEEKEAQKYDGGIGLPATANSKDAKKNSLDLDNTETPLFSFKSTTSSTSAMDALFASPKTENPKTSFTPNLVSSVPLGSSPSIASLTDHDSSTHFPFPSKASPTPSVSHGVPSISVLQPSSSSTLQPQSGSSPSTQFQLKSNQVLPSSILPSRSTTILQPQSGSSPITQFQLISNQVFPSSISPSRSTTILPTQSGYTCNFQPQARSMLRPPSGAALHILSEEPEDIDASDPFLLQGWL